MKLKIIIILAVFITIGTVLVVHKNTSSESDYQDMLILFTDQNLTVSYFFHHKNTDDLVNIKKAADFPTAVLSNNKNELYYTDFDSNSDTQLFKKDLKTSNISQLTKNLKSVDTLKLDEENQKMYMRVLLKGDKNFHIATLDLKTKKMVVWNEGNKDRSVKFFDFNKRTGLVYAVIYSEKELYHNLVEFNNNHTTFKSPLHRFVMFDDKGRQLKEIGQINVQVQDISVSTSGEKVLFTSVSNPNEDSNYVINEMRTDDGTYFSIFESAQNKLSNLQQAQYLQEGRKIYFLAAANDAKVLKDESGTTAKLRSIYQYNLIDQKLTMKWSKNNGIINGFLLFNK
ncbi:hypothetical protein [Paenibacillus sp. RC84]|uniref:hypothetical protein n=1 Tax=Paenibacillus sp. RC84 TaxID=3156252 RepID=UPI00351976A2